MSVRCDKLPATSKNYRINIFALIGVMIAICCLATGGIFVKLSAIDPIASGAWRIALAMPFMFFGQVLDKKYSTENRPKLTSRQVGIFLIAGAFLGMDLALWNISFSYTTVANANLLANLVPFVVIPLSWLVYREKVSATFIAGLFLAVFGVVILLASKPAANEQGALVGDALAALTAVFYALYILIVSRLRQNNSAATVMYWTGFGALIVLIPLAVVFEDNFIPSSIAELWPLLGLALISHGGGQGLLAQCLRYVPANLSSVLVVSQPVVAAVYAWILFAESLTLLAAIGILICLFGIYIAKRSSGI